MLYYLQIEPDREDKVMIFVLAILIVVIAIGWVVFTNDFATIIRAYLLLMFLLAGFFVGTLINQFYLLSRRHYHQNIVSWLVIVSTFLATQEVVQKFTEHALLVAIVTAWLAAVIMALDIRDKFNGD